MTKLSQEEIERKIKELSGWMFEIDSIKKTFEFENFLESVDFVNKIAPEAESMQHHPDIKISYNKVTITLSTHDAEGVTEKDFSLAVIIDSLFS